MKNPAMLRRRLHEQASPLAGRTLILDRMNKRVPSLMGPRLSASMSSYFGSSSANSPISRGPPPRSMRTGETFSSILPGLGHPTFCHPHPCVPLRLCRRLESPLHDPGLDLLLPPPSWQPGLLAAATALPAPLCLSILPSLVARGKYLLACLL